MNSSALAKVFIFVPSGSSTVSGTQSLSRIDEAKALTQETAVRLPNRSAQYHFSQPARKISVGNVRYRYINRLTPAFMFLFFSLPRILCPCIFSILFSSFMLFKCPLSVDDKVKRNRNHQIDHWRSKFRYMQNLNP